MKNLECGLNMLQVPNNSGIDNLKQKVSAKVVDLNKSSLLKNIPFGNNRRN